MKGNAGRTLFYGHVRNFYFTIRRNRLAIVALFFAALLGVWAFVRRLASPRRHRGNACQEDIVYRSLEELEGRIHRFPSVEDRIKLYTSNWYRAPCSPLALKSERIAENDGSVVFYMKEKSVPAEPVTRLFRIDSKLMPARMFYGNSSAIRRCTSDTSPSNRMRNYCEDVNNTVLPLLSTSNETELFLYNDVPVIFQFGDAAESRAPDESGSSLLSQPRIPHLKKFRLAYDRTELERVTDTDEWDQRNRDQSCELRVPVTVKGSLRLQPIIWKLNIRRHFGRLRQVPCNDRPWHEKQDKAVFRGKLTGEKIKALENDWKGKCRSIPRCRLILDCRTSRFVDARLTSTSNVLPELIDDFNLTAPVLHMKDILSYKGIVILEGNDVSSGLKWALLSSSVVLMPEPFFTSWAMEELLEPWIHYIPIERDFSDLDEKVIWMIRHDAEARRISDRATLWIKDLVFHPRANEEEALIFRGILDRYSQHFDGRHARI